MKNLISLNNQKISHRVNAKVFVKSVEKKDHYWLWIIQKVVLTSYQTNLSNFL